MLYNRLDGFTTYLHCLSTAFTKKDVWRKNLKTKQTDFDFSVCFYVGKLLVSD